MIEHNSLKYFFIQEETLVYVVYMSTRPSSFPALYKPLFYSLFLLNPALLIISLDSLFEDTKNFVKSKETQNLQQLSCTFHIY